MSGDVTPRLKVAGPCEGDRASCMLCRGGTPRSGVLYVRRGVARVRGCQDASSRGRANRRKGLDRQRVAAAKLDVRRDRYGVPGDEERWVSAWAIEVKASREYAPVLTAWRKLRAQIDAGRADHGDRHKPPLGVVMPHDSASTRDAVVLIALDDWHHHMTGEA